MSAKVPFPVTLVAKIIFSFSTNFFNSFSAKEFLIAPPHIIIGFFDCDISKTISSIFEGSGDKGRAGNLENSFCVQISSSDISAFCISNGKQIWHAPGLPDVLSLKALRIIFPKFLGLSKISFHLVRGLNNSF